jgi:uncharacterized protein YigE (DUF2233 family)
VSLDRMTDAQYAEYLARFRASPARMAAAVAPTPTRAKYRNTKTELDGYLFDSKKEAARWQELRLLEKGGIITDLIPHPCYGLHAVTPSGDKLQIGTYKPDFQYREAGVMRIEDVKVGVTKTEAYQLRKRIFEAEYGLLVVEV